MNGAAANLRYLDVPLDPELSITGPNKQYRQQQSGRGLVGRLSDSNSGIHRALSTSSSFAFEADLAQHLATLPSGDPAGHTLSDNSDLSGEYRIAPYNSTCPISSHAATTPTRPLGTDRASIDLTLSPSRIAAFENHTRFERDSRRANNHATPPSHTMRQASPIHSPPRARKQSSTSGRPVNPVANLEEDFDEQGEARIPSQNCGFGLDGANDSEIRSIRRVSPTKDLAGDPADMSSSAFIDGLIGDRSSKGPAKVNSAVRPEIQDSSAVNKQRSYLQKHVDAGRLLAFDFSQLNPEVIPPGYTNIMYRESNAEKRTNQLEHLAYRLSSLEKDDIKKSVQNRQIQNMLDIAKHTWPMFRRVLTPRSSSKGSKAPSICRPRSDADSWPDDIPADVINHLATNYLSREDVRNLRLVNKPMSEAFSPIYFRSLVTPFGEGMFAPAQQYGGSINKFGISFEVDLVSLYHAKPKVSQEMQQSWWGDYKWPKPAYQRFPELEALEDLVDDNKPLLKKTLQILEKASELALSIDSGHGWLNGPDLSDMQVWDLRHNGSKVFGKTFDAANKQEEHLRNELFRWAQQNTINQSIKYLVERSTTEGSNAWRRTKNKLRWLENVTIRDYKSFELESTQFDHHGHCHTGGPPPTVPNPNQAGNLLNQLAQAVANAAIPPLANTNLLMLPQGGPPPGPAWQAPLQVTFQAPVQPGYFGLVQPFPGTAAPQPRAPPFRRQRPEIQRAPSPKQSKGGHKPQWPLIFNGYNVAAELGGQNSYVQDKINDPDTSPLKPGRLSEAQAQWLMETFWAQRAFLSAYTTSVILNKANLKGVHALNLAKLSSGLLPLLEQHEFWRALSGLRKLTIIISPDWRREHIPDDKSFQTNMLISPATASVKLTDFLHRFICGLENLSELSTGFVGGGEHAPGILARNKHILPAPITQYPGDWVSAHYSRPPLETILSFNHIKNLTFQNCWFSPYELIAFLEKSRDTSLRRLTLDSVSLTAQHATGSGTFMPIAPQFGTEAWLNESLPNDGCWPAVLDMITPGMTFLEKKDALGLYLDEESRRVLNERSFRGNVEEIKLKSCGYVLISGVTAEELNQSELLHAQPGALDEGLTARMSALQAAQSSPRRSFRPAQAANANANANPAVPSANSSPDRLQDISGRVMMSTLDPTGQEYFGLGTIVQAVYPVEKRVLEQAWGMRFGWGDDMKRWSAVDDGCYEGGTGRFSGSLLKGDKEN